MREKSPRHYAWELLRATVQGGDLNALWRAIPPPHRLLALSHVVAWYEKLDHLARKVVTYRTPESRGRILNELAWSRAEQKGRSEAEIAAKAREMRELIERRARELWERPDEPLV